MRKTAASFTAIIAISFVFPTLFSMSATAQGPPFGQGPGALVVRPDTVYFTKAGESDAPLVRTVQIRRTGPPAALAVATEVSYVSAGGWLQVSGPDGNKLTLTANPAGLAPGIYQAKVTVTPNGEPEAAKTINAFLRIISGPDGIPAAFVRPASLTFRMVEGEANPEPRYLNVSTPTGGVELSWSAAPESGGWLQINPTSGTGPGLIEVSVNGAGLPVGEYQGKITVTSGSSAVEVPVTLLVRSLPAGPGPAGGILVPVPRAFNFIVHPGAPVPGPKTMEIKTGSPEPVSWTADVVAGADWLQHSANAGTTPGSVDLSVVPGALAPGHYLGVIEVSGGGVTVGVRVFLRILGAPATPPGQGQAIAARRGPSAVVITPPVMEFTRTNGTVTPEHVAVNLRSRLSGLSFTAAASTARGGAWLNLSSTAGEIPGSIQVSVLPGNLDPGVYTGLITFQITGAVAEERFLLVVLRVSTPDEETPRLMVRPGGVLFHGTEGGASPVAQQVSLLARGAESIPYQAMVSTRTGGNWLSVTPEAGVAPADITVNVNLAGVTAGRHSGAVVFQASGGPGAIPATLSVLLAVGPGPGASSAGREAGAPGITGIFAEPAQHFAATANVPKHIQVMLVDSEGNPVEGARVQLTSSGPEPPVTLEEAGDGVYAGVFLSLTAGPVSLAVNASKPGHAPAMFGVGGDVEGAPSAVPAIFLEGIVNAADFTPGSAPLAPGSIASLFGQDLAESDAVAPGFPLPRELGGVSVLVGGEEAPLISVSKDVGQGFDQINFQLPVNLGALSFVDVAVLGAGMHSGPQGISIAPRVPAVFALNGQGTGPAAAQHADWTLVTAQRPAMPGEPIILYATGLGAVVPSVAAGQPARGQTQVTGHVEIKVGGLRAEVEYAGLAPDFAGLYQLNTVIPAGVGPGEVSLEVSVDGIPSAKGVTLHIGP